MTDISRRQMLVAGVAGVPLVGAALQHCLAEDAPQATGPLLGHVDHELAIIWYRPAKPGVYAVQLIDVKINIRKELLATSSADNDLCVTWRLEGLNPATEYRYRIVQGEQAVAEDANFTFHTAPAPNQPVRTSLVLGSCASSVKFFDIWTRIESLKPDGLVLLGDTPYIDSSDKKINRDKHREFLSMPTLAHLSARTPTWGTWDDHDFGKNDSDGNVKGKEVIRKVFTEYRALKHFGDGSNGVYTNFRLGGIEVFLLDPRYFAQTEQSPVDAEKPTCLGKKQWAWLLENLKASTASFKVLATGMIWDDKKNKEKDDWETYAHEREAIFNFIGANKITGVLLIGGDIHVSRHLQYPTTPRVGYDLHQFIISPLHDRTIPSLNVPHPQLVWGEPLPNMFLHLVCDTTAVPATLSAAWIDRTGKTHREVKLTERDLSQQAKGT